MMMGKWDAGPEHSSVDEIPVLVHCILKMIEANKEFNNWPEYLYSGHSLADLLHLFFELCVHKDEINVSGSS